MASTLELLMLARMLATPVGRCHATSAQSAITSAVPLAFQAVDFDNLGGFNATGVYTVQAAGTYRVYSKTKFANTAANWTQLSVYKNGVLYSVGPSFPSTTTGGGAADVDDLVQCNVGDTLTIYVQSQASIATSIADGGGQDVYFTVSLTEWA